MEANSAKWQYVNAFMCTNAVRLNFTNLKFNQMPADPKKHLLNFQAKYPLCNVNLNSFFSIMYTFPN